MTATLMPALQRGDIGSDFFLSARKAGSVALDIETTGLDWKFDRVATVQLALASGETALVQIEPDRVPENILTLLEVPGIQKIFHFAAFDLGFLVRAWGMRPQGIACTKVLSKILFPDAASHSLQSLLATQLGIHISKSSVRTSNWTATDLTPEQVAYALNDVRHLHALFDHLMVRAIREGVAGIAEASFDYLPIRVLTDMRGAGDIFDY